MTSREIICIQVRFLKMLTVRAANNLFATSVVEIYIDDVVDIRIPYKLIQVLLITMD